MQWKKKWLAALALLTLPLGLLGQPALARTAPAAAPALPDADPALWVVRDEDTTIYLFGTFHLLDGRADWFNDEVRTAFDQSDELVLEAIEPDDPAATQQMVMRYALGPDGRTLSQRLPQDLNQRVGEELAAIGIPAQGLEPLDPWFVATTLAVVNMQRLGLTGEHGAEKVLTAAARDRSMPIGEIESMEWQLEMFDSLPEAMQVAQLQQTVDQIDKIGEQLRPMLAAWSSGDTEALARLMNEGTAEHPELYRILLTDRNARWAEWIERRLARPGTVFLAVGAGHLGGDGSLQEQLLRRGIAAERVRP